MTRGPGALSRDAPACPQAKIEAEGGSGAKEGTVVGISEAPEAPTPEDLRKKVRAKRKEKRGV